MANLVLGFNLLIQKIAETVISLCRGLHALCGGLCASASLSVKFRAGSLFFVVKNAKLSHVADLGLGFHFRLKKCEGSQLSALRLALQSKSASLGHVMSACCEAGL